MYCTFFFFVRAWGICPRCTAACTLIVQPLRYLLFKTFPLLPPVRLLVRATRETPSSERWNYMDKRHGRYFAQNVDLHVTFYGSFTCRKSTTWDRRLYFASEGRRTEDFYLPLKNLTASAGFEPANLGTKSQHATSRPPKPLSISVTLSSINSVDTNNLSGIWPNFGSPLLQMFISTVHADNQLKLHTLREMKHQLDAVVFRKAGCGFNFFHRLFLDARLCVFLLEISTVFPCSFSALNPYPTAFPYGNGMVLHFYQQQESSTTKNVHKVINKGFKAYVYSP